nr:PREDICTED: phospholipid scramblase 2-like [Tribolium castaneum]|eukprot:XP_015837254.1 PREDICTED: phospholipid scramblase 2-like [Tribolium castaneum]
MAGLGQLAKLDQLILRLDDRSSGTRYKISVENSAGQELFTPGKVSGRFSRNVYLSLNDFNLEILDNSKSEVIHLHRPALSCCSMGGDINLKVYAPPRTFVGEIKEKCSLCGTQFWIKDAFNNKVFLIKGPTCFCCTSGLKFKILSAGDGTQVGLIAKEADTKALRISFPKDLDVQMKAVMLGASFLIFAVFFNVSIDQLYQYYYPDPFVYV